MQVELCTCMFDTMKASLCVSMIKPITRIFLCISTVSTSEKSNIKYKKKQPTLKFNFNKSVIFLCASGKLQMPHGIQTPIFKLTLTCLCLSWGSRPGGTPTAVGRRKCWGPLRRRQVLQCNFPVQRSRLKCQRWQCCWNCPAGAQRNLILASLSVQD